MVARFQAGEVPVFLLSLKAGGTGLNLTRADHVIHFDRWWNPAVEDQATDRAYRIGQTKPVQVHRLVTTGTIEERIAELLTRKRALADSVLAARGDRPHRAERRRAARPGHAAAPRVRTTRRDGGAAPPGRRPLGSRRHAPTPGGARRGCAPSRRRRTPRPTSGAPAAWPGRDGSAGSPSTTASFLAAVADGDEVWTVSGGLPVLDDGRRRRPWSRRSPRSRAGSPRCSPATCRSPSSSTPRRPASSCLPYGGELEATVHLRRLGRPVPARARRPLPAGLAGRGRPARAAASCAAWRATSCCSRPARRWHPTPARTARTTTSSRGSTPRSGRLGCWSCSRRPASRWTHLWLRRQPGTVSAARAGPAARCGRTTGCPARAGRRSARGPSRGRRAWRRRSR